MLFFISLLGFLSVAYGIVALILNVTQKNNRNYKKLPLGIVSISVGLVLFLISMLIVKVSPTEVGIVITPTGVSDKSLQTGWHIVALWNTVDYMEKTVNVYTFAQSAQEGQKARADAIWTPTGEGIKLGYDLSVTWQLDESHASYIYKNIPGGNFSAKLAFIEENLIRAITKTVVASTVKNYAVIDAYTVKRDSIQLNVEKLLTTQLSKYKITLIEAGIREVHYNIEYETAINNKKLAEQEALRLVDVTKQKQELLIQAKINKDIAIQTSMGEAEALKIKGASIASNPKIIELEWINKWSGELPTYMMGNGQGIMLNLGNLK